jgi:quercetin dioxygenase-like cupin family protein
MEELKYVPQKTAYQSWMDEEGIPIIEGYGIEDVTELPRRSWSRLGGAGAYIQLKGSGGISGMYVVEVPAGGALKPERHLYDKLLYVLKGRGATEVWLEGQRKQIFEWGEGSLFSPPLNTWHRLVNGAPAPALLLAVTTAPVMMDFLRDPEFIFNTDYQFKSRYRGEENYFAPGNKRYRAGPSSIWETNFIADARSTALNDASDKVSNGQLTCFEMADNSLVGHVSEWPAGIYHKAHYHSAGAVLLVLKSKGYILMWPKELGTRPYEAGREDQIVRVKWKPGSVYSPPDGWFHMHLNTGAESARHAAFRLGSRKNPTGLHDASTRDDRDGVRKSLRQGGTMIDYEDEDPQIRKEFEDSLKREGVACKMPAMNYR